MRARGTQVVVLTSVCHLAKQFGITPENRLFERSSKLIKFDISQIEVIEPKNLFLERFKDTERLGSCGNGPVKLLELKSIKEPQIQQRFSA